jgi:predicted PolB exonuclease-like 3'-5' exonuclease
MNLIAFALSSIPNISAARRLYDVEGLDDEAVAKILFHRRKQETGREALRPDQQRIAVLSLIHGEPEQPRLMTLSSASDDEATILRHLGETLGGTGRLAGWHLGEPLTVLRLRTARLGVALPRLWQDEHLDLADTWGADACIDQAARLMGLPGLGASHGLDAWEAWLAGDQQRICSWTELRVLNSWQLAHKLLVAQGRLTPAHARAGVQALRQRLAENGAEHLRDYAAALED